MIEAEEAPAAQAWMATEVVHPLLFPIDLVFKGPTGEPRTEKISQVTIRRLSGEDLEAIEKFKGTDMGRTFYTIARISELTQVQAAKLDAADLGRIGKIIEGFQEPGLSTGETSSET